MKKDKKVLTTIKIDSKDGSVNIKKQGYASSLALPNAIVAYNDANSVTGYIAKSSLNIVSNSEDGLYIMVTINEDTLSAVKYAKEAIIDILDNKITDLNLEVSDLYNQSNNVKCIDIKLHDDNANSLLATPKEPKPSSDRDIPEGGVLDYHGVEVFAGDKVRYMYERGLESGEYICYVGDKYELILNNTPTKHFLQKGINYQIIKESK